MQWTFYLVSGNARAMEFQESSGRKTNLLNISRINGSNLLEETPKYKGKIKSTYDDLLFVFEKLYW